MHKRLGVLRSVRTFEGITDKGLQILRIQELELQIPILLDLRVK
jgi:hypothetical protein